MSNDIQSKRDSLLNAKGELKVGRRESSKNEDESLGRKTIWRGVLLGAIVVIAAIVVLSILGMNTSLG